jgi:membrane-associated protease RseP (regulator of RpoE activity)
VSPQSRRPDISANESAEEAKKQKEFVIEKYIQDSAKITNIAAKIRLAGTNICESQTSLMLGLKYWNIHDFLPENENIARNKYQLGAGLKVLNVASESPAEKAGFKVGDELLAINDLIIAGGKNAKKDFAKQLDEFKKTLKPLTIKVWREGEEKLLSVTPVKACKSDIELIFDNSVNAYADGTNIYIAKGMMNFVQNEEEIALVISHELAHNVMNHIDAKKTNAGLGMAIGLLLDIGAAVAGVNTQGGFTDAGGRLGGQAFSVDFENEADYVGIYFMANANYKIDNVALFWRRMAQENPNAITLSSTHPSTSARFVSIEKTIAEIKQKQINNKPLKPEMKIKAIDKVEDKAALVSQETNLPKVSLYEKLSTECKSGLLSACSEILVDASNDNSSIPRDVLDNSIKIFKKSNALSDQDKLVFYDYSMSKIFKPEKDLAEIFIKDLLLKEHQGARLRDIEDKLSSPFITFQRDKKNNYCNEALKIDTTNFNQDEMRRFSKISTNCNN